MKNCLVNINLGDGTHVSFRPRSPWPDGRFDSRNLRVGRMDLITAEGLCPDELQQLATAMRTADPETDLVSLLMRSRTTASEHTATLVTTTTTDTRTTVTLGTVEVSSRPRTVRPRGTQALGWAARLLPAALRERHLDEWLDQIETAAEHGEPTLRPTLSLLLRAVPRAVLRAWRPGRAIEGER